MTLTMIIAIIAAMLFGVFCALCLYAIFKNQKDVEKNENRMKGIENKLGSMTELINDRTEMLENRINEQPIYNVYSDVIDVNPSYPYDRPAEGTESTINISDLMADDFEDLLIEEENEAPEKSIEEDEVLSAFMNSFKTFEKEVIGTEAPEAEVDVKSKELDVFDTPEVQEELAVPDILKKNSWAIQPEKPETIETEIKEKNPFKHHMGHDVGRSGKKYTASELEKLIRE